jgi:hypothetical protein
MSRPKERDKMKTWIGSRFRISGLFNLGYEHLILLVSMIFASFFMFLVMRTVGHVMRHGLRTVWEEVLNGIPGKF